MSERARTYSLSEGSQLVSGLRVSSAVVLRARLGLLAGSQFVEDLDRGLGCQVLLHAQTQTVSQEKK